MTVPAFDIPGYEFVRELGSGGMATVYLSVQKSLDRKVAIKVMRRGLADANTEQRFLNEGRTMARLPHAHIVGVYDIVQNDTINYIAMEYLEGGLLSDRMHTGLSLGEAIAIIVQIAGALQFAHDNGVVHRDLKPTNVMFRDGITAVLTDFGIARAQGPGASRLTQTGMMLGTPTYMSPEQATASEVDGRSDQYSLGVLFYEMLTGHAPFEGESPIQVALAHVSQPPPPLPPQFSFFQPVMDRMLAKLADHRYPDLNVFVRELKSMVTGSTTLMARLQIDPNYSSSEQLRALGFSDSQINTGSRRVPTQPPSEAVSEPPRRSTQSGPGVRLGGGQESTKSRPPWLIPAAAAAGLLVMVLIGWLLFAGGDSTPDVDPALRSLLNDRLQTVDQLIAEQRLVTPAGESAYDKLQEVLQLAPELPEAQQRLASLTAALRKAVEDAVAAKTFDVAERRVSEALAVAPKDPDLLLLQASIASARVAAQREAAIADLLQRADAARRAGKLVGSDGGDAWGLLQEAQQLDPDNADVASAQAAVSALLLKPAVDAISKDRLADAERELTRLSTVMAADAGWKKISAQLEQRRVLAEQQARIDELLAQARKQFSAGRLMEPIGNNVLESLARIAEIDPTNIDAARIRADSARALAARAEEAEAKGDFSLAYSRYEQALQADPSNRDYRTAREAVEARLGERRTQLAKALSDARSAIAQRRYFAPAGNSAADLIDAALKADPSSAEALDLQKRLPAMVRESAQAIAQEGRLDEALALLAEASRRYASDAELGRLTQRLQGARDQAQRDAARDDQLTSIRGLLARGSLDLAQTRRVLADVGALLKADSGDAAALQLRQQLVGNLTRDVQQASSVERMDALRPLVDAVEKAIGSSDADVRKLVAGYSSRRDTLASAEEKARLASQGQLVLTAAPWASVESVVEQGSGKSVPLPEQNSTPLRLALQAGTYRVTFKHPGVRQPVIRVIGLAAKQTSEASATFPAISSESYLEQAGYGR